MADVTFKLIVYRLGEAWDRAGERYNLLLDWYSDFSWRRVDILDMLFLGWLFAAFVVVGAINLYLRFFGLPRYGKAVTNGAVPQGSGGTPIRGGESCTWINSALSWIYLHYNSTPEFVDAWIKALNDEAKKHAQGEFQVKFDRIQAGSLPPKLQQVSTDTSTKQSLTIRANVDSTDTTFLVSAIRQTATNIKVIPCDVNLQRLQGQLRVYTSYDSGQEEIRIELQFDTPPELKLQVKPRNYENNIDPSTVEKVVRSAICGAVTSLTLPSRGGFPNFSTAGKQDFITPTLRTRTSPIPPRPSLPTPPASAPKTKEPASSLSGRPSYISPYYGTGNVNSRSTLTVYTTNATLTTPSSIERATSVPGNLSDGRVGKGASIPATNAFVSRRTAGNSSADRDPPSAPLINAVSSSPPASSRPSGIGRTVSVPGDSNAVRPTVPHSLSMGSTPGAYPPSIAPRPRVPPPAPPAPYQQGRPSSATRRSRIDHLEPCTRRDDPPLGYMGAMPGPRASSSIPSSNVTNSNYTAAPPRVAPLKLATTKSVSSRPSESSGPSKAAKFNRPLPRNKIKPDTWSQLSGTRSLAGRRLLVKVIKANGLGDRDFESAKGHFATETFTRGSTDPYCIVTLDDPPQKHTTSVVKNTVNPFWDEHFLLELEDTSRQVKFEVYDREKPPGDDFLGRAMIAMEELKRMPSSRQIIPLTGRPRAPTSTSGSITIEFLFMEGTEAQLAAGRLDESLSPRRRIETNRQIAPGGTVVTTTTTTTERPRDTRLDAYGEPSRIEKSDYSDPTSSNGRASSQLGAHDAALTASQEQTLNAGVAETALRELQDRPGPRPAPRTPTKTTTLTITGVTTQSRMTETAPGEADYQRDNQSLSTTTSDQRAPVAVKMAELLRKKHERDMKKSRSFTSAIKRRFGRNKKPRSHSADRAQSASFREGSLLKPPDHPDINQGARTAEDIDMGQFPEGQLRKSRSHSFSSSLKRIFRKKKKGESRESSLSRVSGRDVSREGSVSNASPYLGQGRDGRGSTPLPDDYSYDGEPYTMSAYGTSAPTRTSPLYDH